MGTARIPDYEGARTYALEHLARDLPSCLYYHSLWHTRDEVAARTEWLSRQEGPSNEATLLVGTAAYFHDIGFIRACTEHEKGSARIAVEVLPHFGYRPDQVQIIKGIIFATRLPQSARAALQQIMADADLDVLFAFLAECYERRSVVITSNLVFSTWNQIFKDPLTTAAAIDRVVHHSLIIEFGRDVRSVRAEEAARRNGIVLGNAPASQPAEA